MKELDVVRLIKEFNGVPAGTEGTIVLEYAPEMLMQARHQNELTKSNCTHIRIDYKNSGLGSNSCGPELLEKYRLAEKEIHFEFSIK